MLFAISFCRPKKMMMRSMSMCGHYQRKSNPIRVVWAEHTVINVMGLSVRRRERHPPAQKASARSVSWNVPHPFLPKNYEQQILLFTSSSSPSVRRLQIRRSSLAHARFTCASAVGRGDQLSCWRGHCFCACSVAFLYACALELCWAVPFLQPPCKVKLRFFQTQTQIITKIAEE